MDDAYKLKLLSFSNKGYRNLMVHPFNVLANHCK